MIAAVMFIALIASRLGLPKVAIDVLVAKNKSKLLKRVIKYSKYPNSMSPIQRKKYFAKFVSTLSHSNSY